MEINMIGGKKLSEGGYGCIFNPEINCKGKQTKNKKHVSKLQFETFSSKNQNTISEKIIKNYKKYHIHFSPIISSCEIKIKKLDDSLTDDCDVLQKLKTDKISISKIKYINNVDYEKYVMNNLTEQGFFYNRIIKVYYNLLSGVKLLTDINIVHFDLKGLNIIYDESKGFPIIIDFGLSFDVEEMLKDLNSPKYYYYFYRYVPEYYIWPLEVHFMNLLLHETENPTNADLKTLANKFVYNNSALLTFSNEFKNNYYTECYDELLSYNKLSLKEKKKKIISAWATWDNYSISVMFIVYIFSFNIGNNTGKYNKFTNEIIELMIFNIHPDYKRRYTIEQTIHKVDSLTENINNDETDVGGVINRYITRNHGDIKKILSGHSKKHKIINDKMWLKTNLGK